LKEQPRCPECHETITFLQSFKNFNPWNYKCPNCGTKIKASSYWKVLTILGFFLGVFIASIAIYQEEHNVWQTSDSMIFFFCTLILSLPLSYVSWLYASFESYNKTQEPI
jgi:hypothetical protein